MTKVLAVVLFLSSVAMSAPISCSDSDSTYALLVSSHHKTAVVTIGGQVPQFGKLVCEWSNPTTSEEHVFMTCQSPHVADAGYTASLYLMHSEGNNSAVRIEESWFGGSHLRANIPCVSAQ